MKFVLILVICFCFDVIQYLYEYGYQMLDLWEGRE